MISFLCSEFVVFVRFPRYVELSNKVDEPLKVLAGQYAFGQSAVRISPHGPPFQTVGSVVWPESLLGNFFLWSAQLSGVVLGINRFH